MKFTAKCIIFFLALALPARLAADAFTDILQDLAMQTACVGQYSMTEAGGGWYEDPHDYYTPQMMAARLARMSGDMTRTETFYGVCFDYAQFAWNDIKRYQSSYTKAGMRGQQWYIAGVNDDTNEIILSDPVPQQYVQATNYGYVDSRDYKMIYKQNGVFIKESRRVQCRTHGGAKRHAWLWIQRNDGTWFWIDPTWTDNSGYVVWGYVANGEEIQLRPDKKYCVIYPQYVENLPAGFGAGTTGGDTIKPGKEKDKDEDTRDSSDGYAQIVSIGFYSPFKSMFRHGNMGFSTSYENGNEYVEDWIMMLQIDGFSCDTTGIILGTINIGYQCTSIFALYGGGGIGWSKDDGELLHIHKGYFSNAHFAWKAGGGVRATFGNLSGRAEAEYIKGVGAVCGFFLGWAW